MVEIGRGEQVQLHWQRSHVRPESLLDLSLRSLVDSGKSIGAFQVSVDQELTDQVSFRSAPKDQQSGRSETIIEKIL